MTRTFLSAALYFLLIPGFYSSFMSAVGSPAADSTQQEQPERLNYPSNFTEEQQQFFRADALPLSLAERGRLSTSALRGMPPGFVIYRFAGKSLSNPESGFWNEQWIPLNRILRRRPEYSSSSVWLESGTPGDFKPITVITFFQDFETGLSFLDISFSEYLNKTNYFQLAGNNFVRDGTLPYGQSRIQVNTYQTRFHFQLNQKWKMDIHYWQMRHRFSLPPQNIFSFSRDKFKLVQHLAWINLQGKISSRDSVALTSEYNRLQDDYWQEGNHQRYLRTTWSGGTAAYFHQTSHASIGGEISGHYLIHDAKFYWTGKKEFLATGRTFLNYRPGKFRLHFMMGILHHSPTGQQASAEVDLKWKVNKSNTVGFRLFSEPKPLPLVWRTLRGDSIPAVKQKRFIRKQSITLSLKKTLGNSLLLEVEPFVYRTQNYPIFISSETRWDVKTFQNFGVHFLTIFKSWPFHLQNDFTFNGDYHQVFAPQFNNIVSIQSEMSLFKKALRLEGTLVWHVIGAYHFVEFDPLLYSYRVSSQRADVLNLVDFILQAHIKDATLFFVWENILSQDYQIVSGFGEFFRFFRLGVKWRFLD